MFQAMDAQSLIVLYFDILIVKEVAGGRMCGRKEEDWEEERPGSVLALALAGVVGGETFLI